MDKSHYDATVAADWTTFPLFLTTLLYSTGGFNGAISCESTLKNPRNSTLLILIGHITYVFTIMTFGAILYVAGYSGCSIVLDCLPQGIPVDIVKVLLTIALLLTYPVGLSYGLDVLEDFLYTEKTRAVVRYIVRTCLVVITCVIAAAVPDFSVFSNFVGALRMYLLLVFFSLVVLPFVGFIIPSFLFFRLVMPARWWHHLPADKKPHAHFKRIGWALVLIALVTFGISFFVVGVYTSIIQDVA